MKSRFFALCFTVCSIFLAQNSHATLLGDTIQAEYRFPYISQQYESMGTDTVDADGAAFSGQGLFNVLVTDTTITVDYFAGPVSWTSALFNGFVLTNLTNAFPVMSLDTVYGIAGFDASRFSINGNEFAVNWEGLSAASDAQLVFNVVQSNNVPEPLTLALLGIGLLGMGVTRRRKQ